MREGRRYQGRDPRGLARADEQAPASLRVRSGAALGARYRHGRLSQGLRPGQIRTWTAGAGEGDMGCRRRGGADARIHTTLHSSTPAPRRSMPTSTAPRRKSSAFLSRACSAPYRSTWGPHSSTTSTSSGARTESRRRPTTPTASPCVTSPILRRAMSLARWCRLALSPHSTT